MRNVPKIITDAVDMKGTITALMKWNLVTADSR